MNLASGLELLSCELLANPAPVADILVMNVHKHRHELYHTRKAWVKTLVRPAPILSPPAPHRHERVSFLDIGEEVQAGLVGPWDKCTMHIYGDIYKMY